MTEIPRLAGRNRLAAPRAPRLTRLNYASYALAQPLMRRSVAPLGSGCTHTLLLADTILVTLACSPARAAVPVAPVLELNSARLAVLRRMIHRRQVSSPTRKHNLTIRVVVRQASRRIARPTAVPPAILSRLVLGECLQWRNLPADPATLGHVCRLSAREGGPGLAGSSGRWPEKNGPQRFIGSPPHPRVARSHGSSAPQCDVPSVRFRFS